MSAASCPPSQRTRGWGTQSYFTKRKPKTQGWASPVESPDPAPPPLRFPPLAPGVPPPASTPSRTQPVSNLVVTCVLLPRTVTIFHVSVLGCTPPVCPQFSFVPSFHWHRPTRRPHRQDDHQHRRRQAFLRLRVHPARCALGVTDYNLWPPSPSSTETA